MNAMQTYYVYILAKTYNGSLYIGVTSDLKRRVFEHKDETNDSHTKSLDIKKLVYFEETQNIRGAITREKQLKHWRRDWKIRLIESSNPSWRDLSDTLV